MTPPPHSRPDLQQSLDLRVRPGICPGQGQYPGLKMYITKTPKKSLYKVFLFVMMMNDYNVNGDNDYDEDDGDDGEKANSH